MNPENLDLNFLHLRTKRNQSGENGTPCESPGGSPHLVDIDFLRLNNGTNDNQESRSANVVVAPAEDALGNVRVLEHENSRESSQKDWFQASRPAEDQALRPSPEGPPRPIELVVPAEPEFEQKPAVVPVFDTNPAVHQAAVPEAAPPPWKQRTAAARKKFSLGALFQSRKVIGLDIGSQSLKFVVLGISFRGSIELIDCGIRPLPRLPARSNGEDRQKMIAELLRRSLKTEHLQNAVLCGAIAGFHGFAQILRVPAMPREVLTHLLQRAHHDGLLSVGSGDKIAYRVLENNKADATRDVLVLGGRYKALAGRLRVFEEAGLRPAKISPVPVALSNAAALILSKESRGSYAIIDIGANASRMLFVHRGRLLFARGMKTSGDHFTRALTRALSWHDIGMEQTRKQAEIIKRTYGFPAANKKGFTREGLLLNQISATLQPVLNMLADEIKQTAQLYQEKFCNDSLQKVYLTGGGALLRKLDIRLCQALNAEVAVLNPFKSVLKRKQCNRYALEKMGPRFAVAVGIALEPS
ncbi:MAG: pilus assembly protein PilM [bacterium]